MAAGRYFTVVTRQSMMKDVQEANGRLIRAALIMLRDDLRRRLSTPFPPASREGQFPHERTGFLKRHVNYRIDIRRMSGALYIKAYYARFLDEGTRTMKPRKLLSRYLPTMKERIRRAMQAEAKL